jgi:hypothetical protein
MNLATRDVAVGAMSMTLTATAVVIALLPHAAPIAPPPPTAPVAPVTIAVPQPPPLPPGARFSFVFRAGGTTFMQLEDLGTWYPGDIDEQQVYEDDDVSSFIHPLQGELVPPDDRAWRGRRVVLDTGCRARVTGFALVARVVGDPDWVQSGDKTWDPVLLMADGRKVIAATLDGCAGTYARDASLPPAAIPAVVDDPQLAARARQLLETSPAARAAQTGWIDTWHRTGSVLADPALVVTARVLRHPVTGDTWIAVTEHRDHGCGDPDTNLFGLYRLGPYATLLPVAQRALPELDTLDTLLDVDGDGQLELVGHAWRGLEQLLVRHSGTEVSRAGPTFIGGPC